MTGREVETPCPRFAQALHRAAMVAYPRGFRQRFGRELERLFERRVARASRRSRSRGAALAAFLVADALASGLAERARARGWPPPAAAGSSRTPSVTLDSVAADLRLTVRQFARAPVFALLTVASLALGIGANTAIFSVVHAVILRPLPYADPDRLVMIWSDNTHRSEPLNPVSPANFEAFKAAPSLERVEAMYSFLVPVQIRIDADPELVQAAVVTPGLFAALGRSAALGRTFEMNPDQPGVVISHHYWRRRFNGDPNAIGRAATVSGEPQPVPILGVMPEDFVFPYRSMLGPGGFTRALTADVWVPLTRARDSRLVDATGQPNRTIHYLGVVGRLKPDADNAAAVHELRAIASARAIRFPDTNDGWGVTVRPLHEQAVGVVRPALLILLGGVGIVLLMTCANTAAVMLARASGRQHEIAIRAALGASRGRLLQLPLLESLVLAVSGGAIGLFVASVTVRALTALAPSNLPRLTEVGLSWPVAAFALAASLLTGLAVGTLPALSAVRAPAQDALRESRRTTASAARRGVRAGLIVAEVSMATALAVGTGLLLRSFVAVLGVDPGFRPEGLLTLQMNVPARLSGQPQPSRLAYYDDLEARLRAIPGVTNVGGTTRLPLGSTSVSTMLDVEGRTVPPAEMPEVELRREVFDFFGTMGIPVLRGRGFTAEDRPGTPPAAVVNAVLASRVFAGDDPIGRRVRLGSNPNAAWITIVGIVGSLRHGSLEETPRPEIYLTYRQNAPVAPFLVIRTDGDAAALASAARDVIRATGADPPFDVRTMSEIRSSAVSERRFVLLLVALFGGLGLVLAAVGVYGIVTLVAAERTIEVGIRLALGASPGQLLRLMLGHAMRLTLAGVAIGGAAALAASPALSSQLFGIGRMDPATYLSVAATLVAVALAAAYVPARRAMRMDPAGALRPRA